MYLHVEPYEVKYQYLINKREKATLKHYNHPKVFIKYSNDVQDVYKNIEECNPGKKHKVLIAFKDMIANMFSNRKLNSIVTELFIKGRKINMSVVFFLIKF